jgi:hypothetical protein
MKPYLKNVKTVTNSFIDTSTGELIEKEEKRTNVVVQSREEFVQVYTSIEAKLLELSLSEERVLFYCILHCDRENLIRISSYDKKQMQDKWKIANSTIANALTTLKRLKILIPLERGAFRINPTYAWKGTSNDRTTMLKRVLEIECPQC